MGRRRKYKPLSSAQHQEMIERNSAELAERKYYSVASMNMLGRLPGPIRDKVKSTGYCPQVAHDDLRCHINQLGGNLSRLTGDAAIAATVALIDEEYQKALDNDKREMEKTWKGK